MICHSASTILWKSSTFSILISAFYFSDLSSSSIFKIIILGFVKLFGCCQKPAYEKVFLKATPLTRNESLIDPPVTSLIPIKSLSRRFESSFSTAETTISAKKFLYDERSFELRAVQAHLISMFLLFYGVSSSLMTRSSSFLRHHSRAFLYPLTKI